MAYTDGTMSGSQFAATGNRIGANLMTQDRTVYYYQYATNAGIVGLLPEPGGRYKVMFQEENLGSYHSPDAAADDVSGGHTFTPSSGIDLGDLGIPADLSEWEGKIFANISRLRPA